MEIEIDFMIPHLQWMALFLNQTEEIYQKVNETLRNKLIFLKKFFYSPFYSNKKLMINSINHT